MELDIKNLTLNTEGKFIAEIEQIIEAEIIDESGNAPLNFTFELINISTSKTITLNSVSNRVKFSFKELGIEDVSANEGIYKIIAYADSDTRRTQSPPIILEKEIQLITNSDGGIVKNLVPFVTKIISISGKDVKINQSWQEFSDRTNPSGEELDPSKPFDIVNTSTKVGDIRDLNTFVHLGDITYVLLLMQN